MVSLTFAFVFDNSDSEMWGDNEEGCFTPMNPSFGENNGKKVNFGGSKNFDTLTEENMLKDIYDSQCLHTSISLSIFIFRTLIIPGLWNQAHTVDWRQDQNPCNVTMSKLEGVTMD